MIDRSDTADSKLPQLPNDPIENAESADPTEAIESTEPTLPIDSTEPFEAMLRIESLDRTDQREPFASDTASAFPLTYSDDLGRTLVRRLPQKSQSLSSAQAKGLLPPRETPPPHGG
jgi:hypothetical protein